MRGLLPAVRTGEFGVPGLNRLEQPHDGEQTLDYNESDHDEQNQSDKTDRHGVTSYCSSRPQCSQIFELAEVCWPQWKQVSVAF